MSLFNKIVDAIIPAQAAPVSALEEYFSAIIIINCDHRIDRWEECLIELKRIGINKYQRFSALPGPEDVPQPDRRATIGCMRSHRAVWREIAEGKYGDRVLIFEDDFKFLTVSDLLNAKYTPDSPVMQIFQSAYANHLNGRFKVLVKYIPDKWDLLYLGGGYANPPRARVNKHVIRNAGMLCTHAYAISKDFATWMTTNLDRTNPAGRHPGASDSILIGCCRVDTVCGREVYSYTLSPRLFIQRPGSRSDITDEIQSFPCSLVDETHEKMV